MIRHVTVHFLDGTFNELILEDYDVWRNFPFKVKYDGGFWDSDTWYTYHAVKSIYLWSTE